MKLRVLPASRGWVWVRQGILLCRKQTLGLVSLLGLFIMGFMLVLLTLPFVGPLLVATAMPAAWMAFMLASRRVLLGQPITPSVVIEALANPEDRQRWLRLGSLYALTMVITFLLANYLGPDAETLSKALEAAQASDNGIDDPVLIQSMLWRLGLTLPVSLAFWHTPALVYWARLPVRKAMFFSMVASWRNLGAFTVYGLSWAAVLLLVGLPIQAMAVLLPEPTIVTMAAAAAGLWLTAAFYASLYFSVVECFDARKDDGGQDWSPEDEADPIRQDADTPP